MNFDAVAFLEGLFRQTPERAVDPGPAIRVEDLDPDWRIEFEERAAVREHDGGLPRERAEAAALAEIAERIHRGERFATVCGCRACNNGNHT